MVYKKIISQYMLILILIGKFSIYIELKLQQELTVK